MANNNSKQNLVIWAIHRWGLMTAPSPPPISHYTAWQGDHVGGQYNRIVFSNNLQENSGYFPENRNAFKICSWSPTWPLWRHLQTRSITVHFSLYLKTKAFVCSQAFIKMTCVRQQNNAMCIYWPSNLAYIMYWPSLSHNKHCSILKKAFGKVIFLRPD